MRALIRFLEQYAFDDLAVVLTGRRATLELALRRGNERPWRLSRAGRNHLLLTGDRVAEALLRAGVDVAEAETSLRSATARQVAYASAALEEGRRVLDATTAERAVRLGHRMQELLAAGDEAVRGERRLVLVEPPPREPQSSR